MQTMASVPSAMSQSAIEFGEERPTAIAQRANKPRPLKLLTPPDAFQHDGEAAAINFQRFASHQPMTIEEVLELMQLINQSVKAAQFNSQLATQIFRLCQQLKICGECMEQSHKADLNRVFVSLRQACCRDAGQLGTPCRLKIMELVELRAMAWRPSLAYSQYYLNRNAPTSTAEMQGHIFHPHMSVANHMGQGAFVDVVAGHQPTAAEIEAMVAGPTPVSAPPFGAVPINPFAFAPAAPPMLQQQHMEQSNVQTQIPTTMTQTAAPSHYYLIPASGAFLPQNMIPGPGMMPPASPISAPPQGFTMQPTPQNTMPMPQQNEDNNNMQTCGIWPKGAVTKASPKFPRPQKVPGKNQFRDEIIIRNADSGKIMGVKGRRVAVVEEISKTVISFQKVVQGAKERTLTITGNTEATIDHAKILIEETIRRNVSPTRTESEVEQQSEVATAREQTQEDSEGEENLINIEEIMTSEGGTIKLNCADPEVMQAAQVALQEAMQKFKRGGPNRRSAEQRQLQRERRKSVPTFSPDDTPPRIAPAEEPTHGRRGRRGSVQFNDDTKQCDQKEPEPTGANKPNWRARSTPNLADINHNKARDSGPKMQMRATYDREHLVQCGQSPLTNVPPTTMSWIKKEAPEIVRPMAGHIEHDATARVTRS